MILHYLKVALRNIHKYAVQNLLCVLGLAVGFIALSLSAYWYWFENTYDKTIKDWDRIYTVRTGLMMNNLYSPIPDESLAQLKRLKDIEMVGCLLVDGSIAANMDSNFMEMIGLDVIKGKPGGLPDDYGLCISESAAKRTFGSDVELGRNMTTSELNSIGILGGGTYVNEDELTGCKVSGVFRDLNHSFLKALNINMMAQSNLDDISSQNPYNYYIRMVLFKVRKGTDIDKLEKEISGIVDPDSSYPSAKLVNISKLHEGVIKSPMDAKHVRFIALTSLLLIMCAVVNSISMTVTRITGRRKEMGLRRSCGSSVRKLVVMLSVEMAVEFIISLIVALCGLFLIKDHFADFTFIGGNSTMIVWGCLIVMASAFILSLAAGVITIAIILKDSLNNMMTQGKSRSKRFRMAGLTVQLSISLFCIFCSSVLIRQIKFLCNSNWGIGINGVVNIEMNADENIYFSRTYNADPQLVDEQAIRQDITSTRNQYLSRLSQELSALPMVEYAKTTNYSFVSRQRGSSSYQFAADESPLSDPVSIRAIIMSDPSNSAYGFTILQGTVPDVIGPDEIVVTEATCRILGIEDPLGKTIYQLRYPNRKPLTIVAILKDLYLDGPVSEASPLVFFNTSDIFRSLNNPDESYNVIAKFDPSRRKEFAAALDSLIEKAPGGAYTSYMDDWMDEFLKSDRTLVKLMVVSGLVCIIIAILGVFMAITLACQERRREIAVRKVHGASVKDIALSLLREYAVVLVVSAALSFTAGTIVMHSWLQHFAKIATIRWWIYAIILLFMALLIFASVARRVFRTARENPALVIKSE